MSFLPAWSGRPKCFKSNDTVSSWWSDVSLKFIGRPGTPREPQPEETDTTGKGGQWAEEGNTAAGAEVYTCWVPLQSTSCKNSSHRVNTFKHTPLSPLINIDWAQHSVQVSFGCFLHHSVKHNLMQCVLIQSGTLSYLQHSALSLSCMLSKPASPSLACHSNTEFKL